MKQRDKHKLEGLLRARSDDLRQGRRPRSRRPLADPPPEAPPRAGAADVEAPRLCGDCAEPIEQRRVRAMPAAGRCLACQRAAERAGARS